MMTDDHWAIYALRDIQSALREDKYPDAVFLMDGAIDAIKKRDGATLPPLNSSECYESQS